MYAYVFGVFHQEKHSNIPYPKSCVASNESIHYVHTIEVCVTLSFPHDFQYKCRQPTCHKCAAQLVHLAPPRPAVGFRIADGNMSLNTLVLCISSYHQPHTGKNEVRTSSAIVVIRGLSVQTCT